MSQLRLTLVLSSPVIIGWARVRLLATGLHKTRLNGRKFTAMARGQIKRQACGSPARQRMDPEPRHAPRAAGLGLCPRQAGPRQLDPQRRSNRITTPVQGDGGPPRHPARIKISCAATSPTEPSETVTTPAPQDSPTNSSKTPKPSKAESAFRLFKDQSSRHPRLKNFSEARLKVLWNRQNPTSRVP